MISKITPLTRDTQLVDPETGKATQLFLQIWTTLVNLRLGDLADVVGAPSDGDTLVYDAASQTWIPQ